MTAPVLRLMHAAIGACVIKEGVQEEWYDTCVAIPWIITLQVTLCWHHTDAVSMLNAI